LNWPQMMSRRVVGELYSTRLKLAELPHDD
jgi:hypothetical protein